MTTETLLKPQSQLQLSPLLLLSLPQPTKLLPLIQILNATPILKLILILMLTLVLLITDHNVETEKQEELQEKLEKLEAPEPPEKQLDKLEETTEMLTKLIPKPRINLWLTD
jgi:hypothetical protein